MTLHPDTLGIDISKHHLDVYDSRDATTRRIANTAPEVATLAQALTGRDCLVVFEATGHYDGTLRRALAEADVAHARVNPEQARHFARATGKRAKTDAIDARMLAELGQRLAPRPCPPDDSARRALTALSRRRDQLVAMRKQERTRRGELDDPLLVESLDAHLAWLDQAVTQLDHAIAELVRTTPPLAHDAALLRSVPGIGPVTATVLLAQLPELGSISAKPIAALAGLAPFNNDSGAFRGKRSVRGGRTRVRQALYMAALTAARSKTILGDFHQRLRDAGKPPKLALIALARKLLTTLNAIVRAQSPFAKA
jgi:transposase